MVRYERPSFFATKCLFPFFATKCLFPFYNGLSPPFKPKIFRLLLAGLFWILTFGWMIFCGNLATFRYPKDAPVLPDLLFDILEEREISPLPDVLLYILLTTVVGRMIFHPDGVAIARRFAAIAGCIYFFRSFTLIATSFPNPQPLCQDYTPGWSLSTLLTDKCGGMMGHTVNLVLAALCWSTYSKHKIVSIFAWLAALSGMVTLIVNRSHYTIDVLISLFTATIIWKYYHMALSLPPNNQNRIVMWLEKLDFGTASEDRDPDPDPDHADGRDRDGMELPLTESLGNPGPSKYKELTCIIK